MKKKISLFIFALLILPCMLIFTACGKVEFKINFMVDNAIYYSINTSGNETLSLPDDPTKNGYIFDGWYWDNNVWQRPFTANSLLNEPLKNNMCVYAKWDTDNSPKGTQANFEGFTKEDETTYSISISNAIETLNMSNIVQVSNTSSWKLTTDIQGTNIVPSKIATLNAGDNTYYILVTANNDDVCLYTLKIRRRPIYRVNIYTQNDSSLSYRYDVEEGQQFDISTISIPTKTGYTFVKWSIFNNTIMSNTNIYAEWSINSFNVILNHDGGNYAIDSVSVTYNGYLPNQSTKPQKLGYTFNGYFSSNNEMYYNANMVGVKQYKETNDIELTAKYTIINYNIQYIMNGGTNSINNINQYNIEMDNFHLFDAEKIGYDFVNWTIDGEQITTINTFNCKNLVITANFNLIVYNINYVLNGGINSENNPTTYTIETPTINLIPATFENECVSRWYLESTFENRATEITNGSYGNKVFYAKCGYDEFDIFTIDSNTIISLNMDFINEFNISDIEVPYGISSIQQNVFQYKTFMKSIKIPTSIATLQNGLFRGCSGLESITLPFVGESSKRANDLYQYPFGYIFGELKYEGGIETAQNYFANNISNYVTSTYFIPSNLTTITIIGGDINYGAFYNCKLIKKVIVGDSISTICDHSFYGCSSLENITLPFVGESLNGENSFGYIFGNNYYSGGYRLVHDGNYIPESLKYVTITGGNINSSAFRYCKNIEEILIPEGIKIISSDAFRECSSLIKINIPSTIEEIGSNAFYGCTLLKDVTLGSNIEKIGKQAFCLCSSLTSINIPDKVKTIDNGTFSNCKNLKRVVLSDNIESINYEAFNWCSSLESINLPNNLKTIGKYAFNCTNLSSIIIPSTITSIGQYCFNGCKKLEKIIISKGAVNIENDVFNGCELLTIYCESEQIPSNWNTSWNTDNRPVYLYSETQPTETGNYWHYVNGIITKWE